MWEGDRLRAYKETRNGLLGMDFASKLSPWLSAGCISPRSIAAEVARYEAERVANDSTYWLLFELLWRDYMRFYALRHGARLFFPWGPRGPPPQEAAAPYPWSPSPPRERAWALGATGYPFVDANMRELLATGFMSNRGRQNVASFFAKDLRLDWRRGAEWFESALVDHDPASNWGNWTYVAGVGADPREDRYFLIPKQAKQYDAEGAFMRHWLPELRAVATGALHEPKKLPSGLGYPAPVCPLMAEAGWAEGGGGAAGGGEEGAGAAAAGAGAGAAGGGAAGAAAVAGGAAAVAVAAGEAEVAVAAGGAS